jgi:hypothetical protein
VNLLLPAFCLTLALNTLAFRLRSEQEVALAIVVAVVATVLWLLALAAVWTRCEDLEIERDRRADAERELRRARRELRTVRMPREPANDQIEHVVQQPARERERRAA